MTYSVLIADDEYFIRQRLKKIIPWEKLQLVFAGEAGTGAEVLEILSERHIDIVMLDIKMPQMSGMDAADQIHQLYPYVKIVILSGFNDFDYARSAMRYGVVDYLLKPADPEALTEALTRCIKHLERDAITYRQEQRLLHYEKRVNLSAVLSGGMSPQDLRSRYPELEDVECTWFAGCYIHTEAESEIEKLVAWLKQEGCDCEYHKELDYSYVLQFFLHNDCDSGNIETLLAGYIDQILLADNQVYIFICLGSPCEFDQSWSSAYSAAGQALDYRYFTDKNLIHLSKYPDTAGQSQIEASEEIGRIRQTVVLLLNARDEDGFTAYVDDWIRRIKQQADPSYLVTVVSEFYLTYSIHFREMLELEMSVNDFVSQFISEEYRLQALRDSLISGGLSCISHQNNTPSDVVLSRRIAGWIDDHYSDADLTVAQIADKFNLNPSYMGSVFKKVYQQSLLQYITHVRMEASIHLLAEGTHRVADIAEMVGYTDAFYYSKRFKQIYGVSPKTYSLNL